MPSLMRSAGRPIPAPPALPGAPEYIWYGCDLKTGRIVEELPFVASGPISVILGAYTSLTGSIALADCPPEWEVACDPGRTMLVCVRLDDNQPMQAYIVLARRGGSADTVELSLGSLESYFDRRYVNNFTRVSTDGTQVLIDLVANTTLVEGIGIEYDSRFTFSTMTRHYLETSDQTLYSQMTELMGVQNGPEWTMDIRWTDAAKTRFSKWLVTWPRLGIQAVNPTAVFDMPGSIRDYELSEDFTSSRGGNQISVFGDGEGDTRPSTTPSRNEDLLDAGWPRYEVRRTISGVTDPATLQAHQDALLAWMAPGAKVFTVTADAATAPRIKTDWNAGDTIGVDVAFSPRHPNGFAINARAIGWSLEVNGIGTVTPILEEEEGE